MIDVDPRRPGQSEFSLPPHFGAVTVIFKVYQLSYASRDEKMGRGRVSSTLGCCAALETFPFVNHASVELGRCGPANPSTIFASEAKTSLAAVPER